MDKRDFLEDMVVGGIKRRILADFTRDRNVLELDDDTLDFIWNQCGLENNEDIQELLREEKEHTLKEMGING